jgi:radical SAM protein with 4Fe4S-binding SPASM domain
MALEYLEEKKINTLPRLPLEGNLDLTYRCNNDCRHCWLRIPAAAPEKKDELSFAKLKGIVSAARAMGCRRWSVSGGEPMLRPDFPEIFDYLTRNSRAYSINTNGTLITPKIARLMARRGVKMVALYGATAGVHDHITRNPGSFEAALRGLAYLQEAGAGFTVQLIPMQDNYHQFPEMLKLAASLSRHYRVGAAWLHLSACGNKRINAQILRQRLPPEEVIALDNPDLSCEEGADPEALPDCRNTNNSAYLFSSCIAGGNNFHIDPYGKMTFCAFIKDPGLRYDLSRGTFKDCWDNFIPSLEKRVEAKQEYREGCGSCALRKDCNFCPAYGYLEHRDFNKKVEYLCAIAKANRSLKEEWIKKHRRYFKIADITIQVESDLAFTQETLHPKFRYFEASAPGEETVSIHHRFYLPDLAGRGLGREVYRQAPWAIYKNKGSWIWLGIHPAKGEKDPQQVAVFNSNYTRAEIYNAKEERFLKGQLQSLTMFPSDQLLIARILADREGFYLHSCGAIFSGQGLLFAGHSGAGKSTLATLLKGKAEILCDDRMIVRKRPEGFRIYGTWSHGDMPDVSSASAPLRAIMFLEKSRENRIIRLRDKKEITKRLLAYLVQPFVTVDWWEKTPALIESVSNESPAYLLKFDKSGQVAETLKQLL